jgi:serine kinase of HPr protein (carbohydrate metabolism regulator)
VSQTVHAGAVAIGGRAVLIAGASGSGKSDLALRLIDRGARLVSDDYTLIEAKDGRLLACAPATIAGRIEMRGVGIVEMDALSDVPVCLFVDLDAEPERLPEPRTRSFLGIAVPAVALAALEASAAIKVEAALALYGLSPE